MEALRGATHGPRDGPPCVWSKTGRPIRLAANFPRLSRWATGADASPTPPMQTYRFVHHDGMSSVISIERKTWAA